MTTAEALTSFTPDAPPVVSPGRRDSTGGAGLAVVEGCRATGRASKGHVMVSSFGTGAALTSGRAWSQEKGDWILWGVGAELALLVSLEPTPWLVTHFVSLVLAVVGSLSVSQSKKSRRIAARQEG